MLTETIATSIATSIAAADAGHEAIVAPLGGRRTCLSYGQLRGVLARLQHILRERTDGCTAVGVLANRSAEAYVSVLACYVTGITFVPLNPGFPGQRLRDIAQMSGIDLVLSADSHMAMAAEIGVPALDVTALVRESLEAEKDAAFGAQGLDAVSESAMVYQLFTSGSTGKPKGVPISRGNLHSYLAGISSRIDFASSGRFSQTFDLSFDLSMHDIFVCFMHSGTLVAATDMDLMMPASYIRKQAIDHWFSVPVLADVALRSLKMSAAAARLKTALFCGEALPLDSANAFRDAFVSEDGQLWNLYGPTEATIAFTACLMDGITAATGVAPLGEAFGENRVAILTPEDDVVFPLADGAEGELLLAGAQVFAGYRPDAGVSCFVQRDGERYYRSGDRVSFQGGQLDYRGRVDYQVKVRGYRVELPEIEYAFRETFGVQLVAAVVLGEGADAAIAVAYQSDSDIAGELSQLKAYLPDYMVPVKARRYADLPLNANSKIDRKALVRDLCTDNS